MGDVADGDGEGDGLGGGDPSVTEGLGLGVGEAAPTDGLGVGRRVRVGSGLVGCGCGWLCAGGLGVGDEVAAGESAPCDPVVVDAGATST